MKPVIICVSDNEEIAKSVSIILSLSTGKSQGTLESPLNESALIVEESSLTVIQHIIKYGEIDFKDEVTNTTIWVIKTHKIVEGALVHVITINDLKTSHCIRKVY